MKTLTTMLPKDKASGYRPARL